MKVSVRSSLLAVAGLVCALAFVPAMFADSQARIVRLSFTDGTVQIDRSTGNFEKAIMNMPIIQGTRLVTAEGARAEVEFEDGSTVRLGPDAEVDFTELGMRDDGGKVSAVEVRQGTAYFDIAQHDRDEFRVAFAADQVVLDRAASFRVDVAEDKVALAVMKGDLKVQGLEEVTVKKNQTLEIDPANGKFEVAKGVTEDPLDGWVKTREEYRDRYTSSQSYGAPSAGYYGVSDLNYYGNYFYEPGWGWLWRPYNIGYGWDPFYDGAWCWYPSYGYTWVSSYPWGWAPYRFGRWAYVPGVGWAWVPGGWNSWQRVPRVVGAPPSFRGPQPPTQPPTIPTSGPGRVPNQHPTIIVQGRNSRVEAAEDMPLPRRGGGGRIAPTMPAGGDTARTPQSPADGGNGTQTDTPANRPSRRVDGDRPAQAPQTPGRRVDSDRPSQTPQAPSPRVDRPSAPAPRVDRPSAPSAPSPRVDRPSSPPPSAPRMSAPPSMPRSSPPSGGAHSGGGRPPK